MISERQAHTSRVAARNRRRYARPTDATDVGLHAAQRFHDRDGTPSGEMFARGIRATSSRGH
jgi:hypothetical protein